MVVAIACSGYTIFTLLALIDKKQSSIDYAAVWEKQEIDVALADELQLIAVRMNSFMHAQTEKIGVTVLSYSKTETCIKNLKENLEDKNFITLSDNLLDTLIDKNDIKSDIRTAKTEKKVDNGIAAQSKVISIAPAKWKSIMGNTKIKSFITPKELGILAIAAQIPNKIPTEKQSIILLEIYEKALEEGFVAA